MQKEKSALRTLADMYYESKAPFFGIYVFFMPQLMIRDLELVRRIMIHDFEYFVDRDAFMNETGDPLSINIFSQRSQKWKQMRHAFSPVFSSNKIKGMFPVLQDQIEKLIKQVNEFAKNESAIDLKQTVTCYVINYIVNVFFGVDVDTALDPQHVFNRMYKLISHPENFREVFRQSSAFFFPR